MASSSLMALMFNQSKSWVLPCFCWHPLIWPLFFICLFFFSAFYCPNSQLAFIAGLIESCSIWKRQQNWGQMTLSHNWPVPTLTDPNTQAGFTVSVPAAPSKEWLCSSILPHLLIIFFLIFTLNWHAQDLFFFLPLAPSTLSYYKQ